ncbi:MAG: hypothetical protein RLZZ127_70 [Planctomycetota bacterium]|jgi:formylglycine-generating enzyme required for sulfatase activity
MYRFSRIAVATALMALAGCGGGGGGGPTAPDNGTTGFGLATLTVALPGTLVAVQETTAPATVDLPWRDNQIQFRRIEAASAMLGSRVQDWGHTPEDEMRRPVSGAAFMMSVAELTQAQWRFLGGTVPATVERAIGGSAAIGNGLPLFGVSYDQAVAVLDAFNARPQNSTIRLRLPTNDEWERACRAGSTTQFHWGGFLTGSTETDDLSLDTVRQFSQVRETTSVPGPKTVGSVTFARILQPNRRPNAFGLYDMHGNLWEWVSDGGVIDVETGADLRVLRGGSWSDSLVSARASNRQYMGRAVPYGLAGIRLVLERR